jgi:hypothetical protein
MSGRLIRPPKTKRPIAQIAGVDAWKLAFTLAKSLI